MPDLIYRVRGAEGTIEYLNGAFVTLTGWSVGEWVGRPFTELVYVEDMARAIDNYTAILSGAKAAAYELRLRTRAGGFVVGEFHGSPLIEGGQVVGEQGIARDVTARRTAEQAMRESEERFRLLSEAAFEGVAITEQGKVVDCNQDLAEMLGYTREEMIGHAVIDFVAPEDANLVTERQRLGSTARYEHVMRRKDGSELPVEVQARTIPYQGRSLRLTAIRDISERRHAELIQRAVFRASEAAHTAENPQELFAAIHQIVAELMPARNFYIALYDAPSDLISFPYMRDEFDTAPTSKKPGRGLTEYVLRTGKPLLVTPSVMHELEQQNEVELIGADSVDWLGVPLIAAGKTTGVIAVQTYNKGVRYSEGDRDLLQFLSSQVAMTIERKRSEEALRESKQFLELVVDTSPSMIFVVDAVGRLIFVNQCAAAYYGTTREALIARSTRAVHHQEREAAAFVSDDQEVIHTRRRIEKVEPNTAPDGTLHWFHTVKVPLLRDDGTVQALGISTDITERRQAEADLLVQSAALNAAASPIVITDNDGTIVWVNSAFSDLTGYSFVESIGSSPRDLVKSGVHPPAFYKDLWDTVRAGKVWHGEMTNRRKDGSQYSEAQTITPVKDAGGKITHFIAMKRDLTEEHRLKAQLLQSQKMEGIGRLAGGVAHDFNNLLTVINGTAGIAMDGLNKDDPLHSDFKQILDAGERAAGLTRQLLAFSRRQIMTLKDVDPNRLVLNLQGMLQRLIGEDIELLVVPADELGSVRADPGQLEQVILNLAVNARDAMPGGGTLTIETRVVELDRAHAAQHPGTDPGPHIMLAVSDTGVGMDENTRLRIFEPFFTTKEVGKGTGLGLSTVYGIVKQSRGSIWVHSEPGRGTTFKICLPRLTATAPLEEPAPSAQSVRGTGTLLVVEDDTVLLQLANRILRAAGYTLLTARNGGEALLLLEHHVGTVDLMLTDVVMPGLGGPDLATRLAKTHPAMKVLYTSGHTDHVLLRNDVLTSKVHFIGKPYSPGDLTRKVRDVLES